MGSGIRTTLFRMGWLWPKTAPVPIARGYPLVARSRHSFSGDQTTAEGCGSDVTFKTIWLECSEYRKTTNGYRLGRRVADQGLHLPETDLVLQNI